MQNGNCDRFNHSVRYTPSIIYNLTVDNSSDDNGLEVVVEEQTSRSDEGQKQFTSIVEERT